MMSARIFGQIGLENELKDHLIKAFPFFTEKVNKSQGEKTGRLNFLGNNVPIVFKISEVIKFIFIYVLNSI